MTPAADRVPLRIKLGYANSSIAYAIKDNGFSVFLLLFYNQVIGLDAGLVGLAVMVALFLDAIVDPIVGHFTDRTYTAWGKRHPWLYSAILPVVIFWLLLWHPPQASEPVLFLWLVTMAFLLRASVSCYEIPSLAITAEITADYDERTDMTRWRFLFGWMGGLAMIMLTYGAFLVPEPGFPVGTLNPNGYHLFAIVGAVVMAIGMLTAALSTHRRIATRPLTRLPARSAKETLRELSETLSNRAFLILIGAVFFAYLNQGVSFALANYLLTFVWQIPQTGFLIYAATLGIGVLLAFVLIGPLQRRFGKVNVAVCAGLTSISIATLPYWLRLAGVFPDAGSPILMPLLFSIITIGNGFGVCVQILGQSMTADVVEASQAETGRRAAGVFYAGFFFTQKCATGVGIFLSGMLLKASAFPAGAKPGAVSETTLDQMTLYYAAATVLIGLTGSTIMRRFPINRADHEARLSALAKVA